MSISENISNILKEIELIRKKHQSSKQVNLLAVSKTKPYEDIVEAYESGQRLFGESYAQEACEKVERAKEDGYEDIVWYFIGPIQSNKTRPIAEHFDWVLSCDRQKIAKRLNDQRPHLMNPLNICIQVNISDEEQKSGVSEDEILELAEYINNLPNLKLRGLMAVALNTDNLDVLRQEFTSMNNLYQKLQAKYPNIDTLSIGMTGDMEVAINCGSNLVRIGTKIFGARNYNKE